MQHSTKSSRNSRYSLSNLWYYYKYYLLAALFLIVCILLACFWGSPSEPQAYTALLLNAQARSEDVSFPEEFAQAAGLEPEQGVPAFLTGFYMTQASVDGSMVTKQTIETRVASGDLDVALMQSQWFSMYEDVLFQDLRTCLSSDLLEQLEDRLYYVQPDIGEPYPIGIDVSDSTVLSQAYAYPDEPYWLGVCVNSENTELTEVLIRYLFS